MWEVLHGPGIAIPYAEFHDSGQFPDENSMKGGIVRGFRPTIQQYPRAAFGHDGRFPEVVQLYQDCVKGRAHDRPTAAQVVLRLSHLLNLPHGLDDEELNPTPSSLQPVAAISVSKTAPKPAATWTCIYCGAKHDPPLVMVCKNCQTYDHTLY